jgi:hypothetical protein
MRVGSHIHPAIPPDDEAHTMVRISVSTGTRSLGMSCDLCRAFSTAFEPCCQSKRALSWGWVRPSTHHYTSSDIHALM